MGIGSRIRQRNGGPIGVWGGGFGGGEARRNTVVISSSKSIDEYVKRR